MKPCFNSLLTLTACTLATTAIQTSAQDTSRSSLKLEEVVVTAEKRVQSVQSIPLAVTVFSQADMDLRDATDMRSLQNFTPNLEFNNESGGQNNARVTLRGIGTETLVGGGDPGVALHVDGVYVGRNSAMAGSIFDVERLEVLRGPQGTLYGRNATGGSINVITRKATDTFEAEADVTAGNYDRLRFRGILNMPLTDNVYSRFSVLKEDRDGYLENRYPGGLDNDDKDVLAVRGQLLWESEGGNEVILRAFHRESEGAGGGSRYLGEDTEFEWRPTLIGVSNGDGRPPGAPILANVHEQPSSGTPSEPLSARGFHEISKNEKEFAKVEHQGLDMTVEWALTDNFMLRSITSYQKIDNKTLVDADNSESAIERRERDNQSKQWSQEFNLLSTGDGALEWILGAFYFHEEIEEDFSPNTPGGILDTSIPLPGGQLPGGNGVRQDVSAEHDADSYAVFGQATYSLSEALRVTAGLRYSLDEKEQSRVGAGIVDQVTGYVRGGGGAVGPAGYESVDDDWSKTTGKLGIDYDLTDDSMLYASFSTGYKSGGIPFNGVMQPYEPEEVTAYEVGSKNELFDGRARLNLAAFYYEYEDLQVFRLTGDGPRAENAAQSTVWGIEAEFMTLVTENLRIDGSAGYLEAEYDEYTVEYPPPGADYSGNTLNHAPEYNLNIGGQYDTALGNGDLTVRLDYSRRGDTYFDRGNTDFDLQEAYDLFSANIRYEQDNWFIALYGKNLADEEYITGQLINPPFNCGCRTVGVGEPRTYGVTVGLTWD